MCGAGVESNPSEWLVKQLAAQDGVGKSLTSNAFNPFTPGRLVAVAESMEIMSRFTSAGGDAGSSGTERTYQVDKPHHLLSCTA